MSSFLKFSMKLGPGKYTNVLRIGMICCIALSFGAIVVSAVQLGMHERLHMRYWLHAFPTVISHLKHGLPWDFSAYQGIAKILISTPEHTGALLLASNATDYNRSIVLFPFDDKGYADLSRFAFLLFGIKVTSVFKLYFALMAFSVALFVGSFWRHLWALFFLLAILLGIHAALYAFPVSTELGEITNPRAIGILSIVALAHIMVAVLINQVSFGTVITILLQAALIVFVFFCRSSEAWQIAVGLCFAAIIGWRFVGQRRIALASMLSIVLCVLGLFAYQRATFNPAYFQSQGQLRLMWHNVGIGFALHPELARQYHFEISDNMMFRLVGNRARELGIYDQVFTDRDQLMGNPIGDFVTYDKLARDVVLDIVWRHPIETITLFLYYKPREFLTTVLSAAGAPQASRPDFEVTYIDSEYRKSVDAFFRLTRPVELILFAVAVLGIPLMSREDIIMLCGVTAVIFSGSFLPAMLSYPTYHIVGLNFATTATAIYVATLTFFWIIWLFLRSNYIGSSHINPAREHGG